MSGIAGLAFSSRPFVAMFVVLLLLTVLRMPVAYCEELQGRDFNQLRIDHDQVLSALNTNGKSGSPIELDDARTPALLERGWELAGQWAALYLDTHVSVTADQLKRIFEGFAPAPNGVKSKYGDFLEFHSYSFAGSAIRIAPSVYVIQSCYWMNNSTGNFLVVAGDKNKNFQPLWNIKAVAGRHYQERDEIGRWAHLTGRAYYNGPLDVKRVVPLSPATNGHPRFLVDAVQSADGGTILAQLSVWEWTGSEADLVLIKTYQYALDQDSFHFDGTTLRIGTKEDLVSYFSCGMCSDPKGVWTLRIKPKGVKDLGHRFLNPEMQWADKLLSAIAEGKDVSEMARPDVVTAIKSTMAEITKENAQQSEPEQPSLFSWGMFGDFHRNSQGTFSIDFDEARMRFTYLMRKGKPYFTHVRIDQAE